MILTLVDRESTETGLPEIAKPHYCPYLGSVNECCEEIVKSLPTQAQPFLQEGHFQHGKMAQGDY